MKFSEFLAEIKSSMKQYDSANLIDDVSVHNWVVDALKRFGNLPTIQIEKVLEVKNKKVKLPDGFKSLKLAVKCEPYVYDCDDKGRDILQNTYFYKTIESSESSWNFCNPCCVEEKESCIVEKLYFHNGGKANLYYKNPQWLKLTSYLKRDICTKDCPNLKIKSSKYEISINNKTLYTNFSKGSIYIIYNGFEEDDEGFVIIPDTNQGWLKQYIEYNVKRRIIEEILGNSDNSTNEVSLYQIYQTNESQSFSNAKTELKFKDIEIGLKNYRNRIKKEFTIYNFGGRSNISGRNKIEFLVT